MICFDDSSKFKEVELDVGHFTSPNIEAIKLRNEVMTARQPILVPCQGYPVVLVSVQLDRKSSNTVIVHVTPKDHNLAGWAVRDAEPIEMRELSPRRVRVPQKVSLGLSLARIKMSICETFCAYFDQVTLKLNQRRKGEVSINELFIKQIVIEQIGNEEQVVLASIDKNQGLLLTSDRIISPLTEESPIEFFNTCVLLAPLEITITTSVIDDIERIVTLFKNSRHVQDPDLIDNQALIARSGTPYYLIVDVVSVLARAKGSRALHVSNLKVSELTLDVWSELVLNQTRFLSSEIRLILSILSLSDSLKLDGARVVLPTEHFFKQDWRGSVSDFWSLIGEVYKNSLGENVSGLSVVSSSNMLNVVGGGLFRNAKEKTVNKKFE